MFSVFAHIFFLMSELSLHYALTFLWMPRQFSMRKLQARSLFSLPPILLGFSELGWQPGQAQTCLHDSLTASFSRWKPELSLSLRINLDWIRLCFADPLKGQTFKSPRRLVAGKSNAILTKTQPEKEWASKLFPHFLLLSRLVRTQQNDFPQVLPQQKQHSFL